MTLPKLIAGLGVLLAVPTRADLPPLVPREVLFGNAERASPQLSPDGKRIGLLAPDAQGVLQVWVRSRDKDDAQCVTADPKRGIGHFQWAYDGHSLLYEQDSNGDENFHIYGVDLDSRNTRDLTPFLGVRADVVALSPRYPAKLLVQLNLRDRKLSDVWAVDLRTGALELDTQNPGDVSGWTADEKMVIRVASVVTPEGGTEIRVRDGSRAAWKTLLKVGAQENLEVIDLSKDGRSVFLTTSVGADAARVVSRDLRSGAETLLAEDPRVDASGVVAQPTQHVIQAVAFAPGRVRWSIVDPSIKNDFAALEQLGEGDFDIESRDLADQTWVVKFDRDRGSRRWYLYQRASKKGEVLFVARPKLEGLTLAPMSLVAFAARDGLELHGYLTLPPGLPAKNLPMVLLVHGGPWYRDNWGWDSEAQWLANRGYAVLQVNFRGSTGYGKTFLHAGDRQWGLRMQDDLTDAVSWAIHQGTADPKRVAILGASYGGYAALAGAAFTPELYRCAVDVVGPSSLTTLLRSIPPFWEAERAMFNQRVGNPDDPADVELLKHASPLFASERIRIPMLIGQGANDPRVKQTESEQIVAAIRKNGRAVTYVVYPDEGHGFARPENSIDFFARAEGFLAACLGGRAERAADPIPGSSAVVK
jgi:dipeptidyl aminopeptidase/acylaminoacyl peptidase